MFKMRNVATNKKYILRKMDLEFQNPKFSISCKITFYIIFAIKCKTFKVILEQTKVAV